MCAHNGTHVDAPYHFINDGKGIDKVSLEKFIGVAYVEHHDGEVTADDAQAILERARIAYKGAEVVLLEGIRLREVPDGVYLLNCAPLNLTDTDGAPCRATLMDLKSF